MKTTMKKALTLAAAIALTFVSTVPAFAVVKKETAVDYLVLCGIYQGDENGNLNIENGLTRAELAVILTRNNVKAAATGQLSDWYTESLYPKNIFTDVPGWALPYVNYCYANGLMNGVGGNRFDPSGQVNPKMVCTVIMRQLKLPETDWNYDTSVTKAKAIGLTEDANVNGVTITRGDTAIIIYRSINGHYTKTTTTPTPTPTPTPTTTPGATTAMTIEEMKAEIVRLTNAEREKEGLNPLEVLPELMDCAQAKAQDMVDNDYFSHTSPTYGTHTKMIKSFGINAVDSDENIASRVSPKSVVAVWMLSAGHRKNILDPKHTHIGIGIANMDAGGSIVVQQFVTLK